MVESFTDLVVWQKSFTLVKDVYQLSEHLPAGERFGLIDQMRRSAVSIPSNIAEGSKRGTRKDYVQFLRIAHGSSTELETQLLLVNDLYNINVVSVVEKLSEVQKMLHVMIRRLNATT